MTVSQGRKLRLRLGHLLAGDHRISTCSDLGLNLDLTQVCCTISILISFKMKKNYKQVYKEVVIKLLRHRSPESRVFNMLLKITNQQHVIIRMNYGVSYLTNTLGRFQVKERINSSYFHMCHHRIFNELIF